MQRKTMKFSEKETKAKQTQFTGNGFAFDPNIKPQHGNYLGQQFTHRLLKIE